jgi:hypothetical protein
MQFRHIIITQIHTTKHSFCRRNLAYLPQLRRLPTLPRFRQSLLESQLDNAENRRTSGATPWRVLSCDSLHGRRTYITLTLSQFYDWAHGLDLSSANLTIATRQAARMYLVKYSQYPRLNYLSHNIPPSLMCVCDIEHTREHTWVRERHIKEPIPLTCVLCVCAGGRGGEGGRERNREREGVRERTREKERAHARERERERESPQRHCTVRICPAWEYMFVEKETELQQSCNRASPICRTCSERHQCFMHTSILRPQALVA